MNHQTCGDLYRRYHHNLRRYFNFFFKVEIELFHFLSYLRAHFFNYLDQDSIMQALFASKKWHQECHSDKIGLETKVVSILNLSMKQRPKEYGDTHDDIEDYYYCNFYGSTR